MALAILMVLLMPRSTRGLTRGFIFKREGHKKLSWLIFYIKITQANFNIYFLKKYGSTLTN